MNNETFQKILKDALATLKEKTIYELIEHDFNYQNSLQEHENAEKKYIEIKKELTQEQKEIISEYLESKERNNIDTLDLSYIAGMKDMLHLLISYGLMGK